MTPSTAQQYPCLVRLVSSAECAIVLRVPCRCPGAFSGVPGKTAFGGERIDGTRIELAMIRKREWLNPTGAGDCCCLRITPLAGVVIVMFNDGPYSSRSSSVRCARSGREAVTAIIELASGLG